MRVAVAFAAALVACAEPSQPSPEPPGSVDAAVERRVQIYAAVLREGVGYPQQEDAPYGPVWVADRPRKAGATVGGRPSPGVRPFAPDVQDGIASRLSSTFVSSTTSTTSS